MDITMCTLDIHSWMMYATSCLGLVQGARHLILLVICFSVNCDPVGCWASYFDVNKDVFIVNIRWKTRGTHYSTMLKLEMGADSGISSTPFDGGAKKRRVHTKNCTWDRVDVVTTIISVESLWQNTASQKAPPPSITIFSLDRSKDGCACCAVDKFCENHARCRGHFRARWQLKNNAKLKSVCFTKPIYQPLDKTPPPPTTHLLGTRKVCNMVAVLHDDNFDDVVAVVVAQEAATLRLWCPLNGGCVFVHFESCSGGSRVITGQRLGPQIPQNSFYFFDKEGSERAE